MYLKTIVIFVLLSMSLSANWSEYKKQFIKSSGQVIDRSDHNATHSRAIGYTLYLAYRYQDDATFHKVYRWYRKNLHENSSGLTPKKWNSSDKKNSSDGDIWIAYSMLLMAEKSYDDEMMSLALDHIEAIRKNLIVSRGGRLFLLPSSQGYRGNDAITINLSYYRFDIFEKFAEVEDPDSWQKLSKDGEWLLNHSLFTPLNLHSDWINIDKKLSITIAKNSSFGYDAIRIPLNLMQSSLPSKYRLLLPYFNYAKMMQDGKLPLGTVQLSSGDIHIYDYSFGHLAIYDKLLNRDLFIKRIKKMMESDRENYYAYALYIFSTL